jgi:transcriptional regulator with XRE-family HTH domain
VKRFYVGLGRNIRQCRTGKRKRLSQEELAKRVGLSRTSVTNIEKGRQQVPLHMLYLFAGALGVEPVVLLPSKRSLSKVSLNLSGLDHDVAEFIDRVASKDS